MYALIIVGLLRVYTGNNTHNDMYMVVNDVKSVKGAKSVKCVYGYKPYRAQFKKLNNMFHSSVINVSHSFSYCLIITSFHRLIIAYYIKKDCIISISKVRCLRTT